MATTVEMMTGNGQVMAASVKRSFLEWLHEQDNARRERYKVFREFYEGDHDTRMTERVRSFLQVRTGIEFNLNFCPVPVDVMAERLAVTGFNVKEEMGDGDEPDAAERAERNRLGGEDGLIWDWWTRNRMDAVQKDVHTSAFRDGDSYLITEWDNEAERPVWSFEMAFDGIEGVEVIYDSSTQKPAWAVKYWRIEEGPDAGVARRANVYLPGEIVRFMSRESDGAGDWAEIGRDSWLDGESRPLGVPVTHFRPNAGGYNHGRSELKDVIPVQRAMNKTLLDLLASADIEGFRLVTLTGAEPGDATVAPGQILWTNNHEATWGSLPPGNLQQLISVVDHFVIKAAQVSRTPLSYYQVTGQVASADTQRADDTGLVSKVEDRSVGIGNAWEDAVHMAIKLHNTFGPGGLNEDLLIETVWDSFERVDKTRAMRDESEIVANLVAAGATLEGAASVVEWPRELVEKLLRGDQVDGIEL